MNVEEIFETLKELNIYAYRYIAYYYAKRNNILPPSITPQKFKKFIEHNECKIAKGLLTLYPYFAFIIPKHDKRQLLIFNKYKQKALIDKPFMSQKLKGANGIYFTEEEFKQLILSDRLFKILSLLFEKEKMYHDLKREASNIIYTPLIESLENFYYLNTDPKRTKYFLNFKKFENVPIAKYIGFIEYNNIKRLKAKYRGEIRYLKDKLNEIAPLISFPLFFKGYVHHFFKNFYEIEFQIGFITLNYIIVEDSKTKKQRRYLSLSLQYSPLIKKEGNTYYSKGLKILEGKKYNKAFFNSIIPSAIISANKFLNISSNEKVYLFSALVVLFSEIKKIEYIYGPKKEIKAIILGCIDKLLRD